MWAGRGLAGVGRIWVSIRHSDAVFGYRYLDWEFEDDDPLGDALNNLNLSGPYGEVKFLV